MYICDECGALKEDLPVYDNWSECGSQMVSYREADSGCICGGDFVEASECACCGDWVTETYGDIDYCEDCLAGEAAILENAVDFGEENRVKIELNGCLAGEFTELQIRDILLRELRETKPTHVIAEIAKRYCMEEKREFGDWLEKERRSGENGKQK